MNEVSAMTGEMVRQNINPRLVAMDGPLQGEVIPCSADVISLGRHSANTLSLADPSVSRQHCLLKKLEDNHYQIVDRASRNGTFVNGVPIRERNLEHGDDIRLGSCRFVYLIRQEEDEPTPSATLSQGESLATRTVSSSPGRRRFIWSRTRPCLLPPFPWRGWHST